MSNCNYLIHSLDRNLFVKSPVKPYGYGKKQQEKYGSIDIRKMSIDELIQALIEIKESYSTLQAGFSVSEYDYQSENICYSYLETPEEAKVRYTQEKKELKSYNKALKIAHEKLQSMYDLKHNK
jgi:hypothetical protein